MEAAIVQECFEDVAELNAKHQKKMKRKVLMACIHYLDSPLQVGSQHLARCFVKAGYEVAYISAPLTPMHLFKAFDQGFNQRIQNYRAGGEKHLDGALWAYVPFAIIAPENKPFLQDRMVLRRWAQTSIPNMKTKLARQGFGNVDILYLDSVFQSFWFNAVHFKKSVFRLSDNILGFPGWGKSIEKITKNVCGSVDAVVYSAKTLESYVNRLGPKKVAYVPNGVDFESITAGTKELPVSMKKIPRPIAVYVGAIDEWFDFLLLKQASKALPKLSFVLIGPDRLARKKLKGLPNVYILGPVKHDLLMQHLYNSDVGIIPFNISEYRSLVDAINPLKLYEYMACGLPVVSTDWEELRRIDSPAVLCKGTDEFIKALRKATIEKNDKSTFIQYASEHDWSASFRTLMKAIGESYNP